MDHKLASYGDDCLWAVTREGLRVLIVEFGGFEEALCEVPDWNTRSWFLISDLTLLDE